MPVARGSDDFTVPVPLQERGINVYECLEEERKAVKEMLFMGTCGSHVCTCVHRQKCIIGYNATKQILK